MKNAIPVLKTEYEQLLQELAEYPIKSIGMFAHIKNWFDKRFVDLSEDMSIHKEEENNAST